ncbi:MAG: phosphotransacetylase family protein [Armatimonadota bacterium]
MAKAIYVAATGQHSGKTIFSLGLLSSLNKRGYQVGFMKPVGQRTVRVGETVVDEDAALVDEVFDAPADVAATSPVTVGSGFTADYLDGGTVEPLIEKIQEAYAQVSAGRDVVVVEGTGHAGVGSVFDLSNATVARLLGAQAVVITGGGIGKPIDEFTVNKALFDQNGVRVLGAVANKVLPEKLPKVRDYLQRGLAARGLALFGAIPHRDLLTEISVRQVVEEIGATVVSGEKHLDQYVRRFIIGATGAHRMLQHFGKGVLAILPGDRDDLVLAAMSSCVVGQSKAYCVSGMCLTGGILPHENILRLVRRAEVPVIAVDRGTYETASEVHELVAKTRPDDKQKIRLAGVLVDKYCDVDLLLEHLGVEAKPQPAPAS